MHKKGFQILEKLNDKISIIDTQALGLKRVVACYFLSGKEKALIDMGYRSSAESVIRDLENGGVGPEDLDYLLPTHVHLDHSGSCGTLAKYFSSANVKVHPTGEPHLANPKHLVEGATQLFGEALMNHYGLPDSIDRNRIRAIADEEQIDLGSDVVLRSVWTPGHASHHLSYFLEETNVIFTGDAVGVLYPDFPVLVPTTPPPSFNFEKAIISLERIRDLKPSRFCTPHYGTLTDSNEWIPTNIQALLDWKIKLERLTSSVRTVEEMAHQLVDDVRKSSGQLDKEMPDHLRVLIKVDVLGFLRYFDRRAKQFESKAD